MTRPYAEVIGDPIAHSKSPLIHNFWLAKLGIDAEYRKTRVRAEDLADYFTRRRGDAAWRGCNVTIPHKQAVMPHLDELGAEAIRIGATNIVFLNRDALAGRNSDGAGFANPLRHILGDQPPGYSVVVGTGGAARAVVSELHRSGAFVTICARDIGKARSLAHELETGDLPIAYVPLVSLRTLAIAPPSGGATVVVNASPLGMAGYPALDISLNHIPADTIVYDLVYAPLETPLLAAARARGLSTIDGLQMLVGQAAAAFELFFGQPAPREHDAELRALLTA